MVIITFLHHFCFCNDKPFSSPDTPFSPSCQQCYSRNNSTKNLFTCTQLVFSIVNEIVLS